MKLFMKKYWFLCLVVVVFLAAGISTLISTSKVEKGREEIHNWFASISREDIRYAHVTNWDKDVDADMTEEQIENFLFLLKDMPKEKLILGDGAGEGHLTIYFMTYDEEEILFHYDSECLYVTFDSETSDLLGGYNWEIKESQILDYCIDLFFSE